MTRGFVAYRGPSRLDGAPIVLIVTLASLNTKTGAMAQAWVLRSDISPQEAIGDGRDRSVCGDCVGNYILDSLVTLGGFDDAIRTEKAKGRAGTRPDSEEQIR